MQRFAITADHRHFFEQNGRIEFEQLLTENQLKQANQAIDRALAERLGGDPGNFRGFTKDQIGKAGRNLFLDSEGVRRLVTGRNLAQIMAELLFAVPLRVAYDQVLTSPMSLGERVALFTEPTSLEESSAFQGIKGGVLICLSGGAVGEDEEPGLPNLPGNALFLSAEAMIPYEELLKHPKGSRYLLIVYGGQGVVYRRNEQDPHCHALKERDYVFGDRLRDDTHPIVVRKL